MSGNQVQTSNTLHTSKPRNHKKDTSGKFEREKKHFTYESIGYGSREREQGKKQPMLNDF
jgi:hypothetical protein